MIQMEEAIKNRDFAAFGELTMKVYLTVPHFFQIHTPFFKLCAHQYLETNLYTTG